MKTKKLHHIVFALFLLVSNATIAQTFRPVSGWSDENNERVENFLNSTLIINERKVAVFDADGTVFGQTPHYLADEALYDYAKDNYADKSDAKSKEKMEIIDRMLNGNNVGQDYVKERINFLSGMTVEEVKQLGEKYFHEKYQSKIYPQMREFIANLEEYDFEIWIISASPELLYEDFLSKELGIPNDRILGVRSTIQDNMVTDKVVSPVPQDEGKADVIQTFIKAKPLIASGNSRGDMEMMNESIGLKVMINPDDEKVEKGEEAGDMDGHTVKEYWEKNDAIIEKAHDIPEGNYEWTSGEWGIPKNKSNPDN